MAELRRSARIQEKRSKTPRDPHVRRSARLEFPHLSFEQQVERREVFHLMRLPRELRDMVYSWAFELGFEVVLRLCKQVNEEARPYLWKSRFFVLGEGGMLINQNQDPRRETVLYPHFPDKFLRLDLALHDRVVDKLALIQNLAIKIDFRKLRSTSGPHRPFHVLRQSTMRDRRRANIAGDRLPVLGPPIGLLEPFLSPQSDSRKRNTCEITFKNYTFCEGAFLHKVLLVLVRLNFKNIFVTFRSPRFPVPGERRGDIRHPGSVRRRLYACQKTLEAGLGPAIWHKGEFPYLAFHPSG